MEKVELEKKLRLGTIRSGLLRSYKRLENDISKESGNDGDNKTYDINSSICELLFWINANDEWHCKNNEALYKSKRDSKQDGSGELLGLKHAYNASKHEMNYLKLFSYEGLKGTCYKVEDSSTSPVWINCPDDDERENQVENYRNFIKGEKVLSTFNRAITFLNNVNHDFYFDI